MYTSWRVYARKIQKFEFKLKFKRYDFKDPAVNRENYGTSSAPSINLKRIKVKTIIYYGKED